MNGFRVGLIAGVLGTAAVALFMGARTVGSVLVDTSWKAPGGLNMLFAPTVDADGGFALTAQDIVLEAQVCPGTDIVKWDGGPQVVMPCETVRVPLASCTFNNITDLSTNAQKRRMARQLRKCIWDAYPAPLSAEAGDP